MGFQVCPLPTAVLSSHTQYPHFSFLDLTDEMPKIISEWKQLGVQFDAIYTGYLGSPRQIQIVSGFIDDFRQSDSLVMIDPVLGDNGKLYTNFDEQMILEMRHLTNTDYTVLLHQVLHLFKSYDTPCCLQLFICGRNTAWNAIININRGILGSVYHFMDSLHSHHIRYLMRLRHKCCHPAGRSALTK